MIWEIKGVLYTCKELAQSKHNVDIINFIITTFAIMTVPTLVTDDTLDDVHGLEGSVGIISEPYHVIGMKSAFPTLPL